CPGAGVSHGVHAEGGAGWLGATSQLIFGASGASPGRTTWQTHPGGIWIFEICDRSHPGATVKKRIRTLFGNGSSSANRQRYNPPAIGATLVCRISRCGVTVEVSGLSRLRTCPDAAPVPTLEARRWPMIHPVATRGRRINGVLIIRFLYPFP